MDELEHESVPDSQRHAWAFAQRGLVRFPFRHDVSSLPGDEHVCIQELVSYVATSSTEWANITLCIKISELRSYYDCRNETSVCCTIMEMEMENS